MASGKGSPSGLPTDEIQLEIGLVMTDRFIHHIQWQHHLIAVEESGRFAAFFQCELKRVTDQQGERLVGEVGVIGVRPELTHRGLGRALLLTGLRLLQERGATSAFLETSEFHVPAQRLFTSVGFTHLSTWQWYAKTVEPA
jgi:ribosomal protein S18 acetylase RimI-like enzyme